MKSISTIGLDIAKSVFQVHAIRMGTTALPPMSVVEVGVAAHQERTCTADAGWFKS